MGLRSSCDAGQYCHNQMHMLKQPFFVCFRDKAAIRWGVPDRLNTLIGTSRSVSDLERFSQE